MAFQVTISTYAFQVGVIHSFNAGPDETITCEPGNTLVATVNGSLVGHTIVWKQIPGPGATTFVPVTWITPLNQLDVTYMQTEDSDKFFAFYIDYGTPYQQESTVANYNTPIAKQYVGSNLAVANFTHAAEGTNFIRTLVNGSTLFLVPYGSVNGVANSPPTTYQLTAFFSVDEAEIASITVQENAGTGWTTLATLPGSSVSNNAFTYSPVSAGPSYRLLVGYGGVTNQYQRTPVLEASQATWAVISNPVIAGLSVFDATQSQQGKSLVSSISTFIPTLISFGPNPPQDTFTSTDSQQGRSLVSSINTFIPTLISFGPNPPQDTFTSTDSQQGRPLMAAYSYTIPGGGSVGG